MKHKKRYHYTFVLVFILGVLPLAFVYFRTAHNKYSEILSFEDCVDAGVAITPTYPETCRVPGKVFKNLKQKKASSSPHVAVETEDVDPKNYTYYVEGQPVRLVNGLGVIPPSKTTNKATTSVAMLHGTASFDVNDDLVQDKLFLLTLKTGNEKTQSYYLASLLSLYNGYTGSNAVYLGTDISSTTIAFNNHQLLVEYRASVKGTLEHQKKLFIFNKEIIQEVTQ